MKSGATVDNSGVVTAVSEGSVTVTATTNDNSSLSVECVINVTAELPEENYTGVIQDHKYVDLGLPSGLLWATCNVGASSVYDKGSEFAWGEVVSKDYYIWENYKYCDGTNSVMTKYNTEDGLTKLLPEDDAATYNWGDKWRTPTKAEFQELIDNCSWSWDSNIKAQKVTGQNGNYIYIVASGSGNDGCPYSYDGGVNNGYLAGYYWTSDGPASTYDSAYELRYNDWIWFMGDGCGRNQGLTVHPVCDVYATSIKGVSSDDKSADGIYNVQGQKISSMRKGQVYIINGKKIVK